MSHFMGRNSLTSKRNDKLKGAFLWGDLDHDQYSKTIRIMVHQRNRRIHSGHGFIGSFDKP